MKQKSRLRQKFIIWLYIIIACLGISSLQVDVMAANDNQVTLLVIQTLDTKGIILTEDEQILEYILEAIDGNAPLPQGSEDNRYRFSLQGNQSISLETLTFTAVGEHHYQLRLSDNKANTTFIHNQESYDITIYVTEDTNGLRASMVAVNSAGFKSPELSFTHSRKETSNTQPAPTSDNRQPVVNLIDAAQQEVSSDKLQPVVNLIGAATLTNTTTAVQTGDTTQIFLFIGIGIISLMLIVIIILFRRKAKPSQ